MVGSQNDGEMVSVIDEYVNKGKVAACTAWAWVVGLMLSAWAVMIVGLEHDHAWKFAGMLAATACALASFASVMHVRCYAVRVAGLVRAVGNSRPVDGPRPVSTR